MNSIVADAKELLKSGKYDAAEQRFLEALRIDKTDSGALFGLATVYRSRGDMRAAGETYRKAARLQPGSFASHFNAGIAFYSCGDFQDAAAMLTAAAGLCSDNAEAHRFLGICLAETGQVAAGIHSLRTAARLSPNHTDVWYNLGNVLRDTGAASEAERCFQRALDIAPDDVKARANLGELLQATGRIDEALGLYEQILLAAPCTPLVVSNALLCLNYTSRLSPGDIFSRHRDLAEACFGRPASQVLREQRSRDGRRLRVGYVSPDFRTHSVAYFLQGIFQNHDHGKVEIYCYANMSTADHMTEWFQSRSVWRDILHDSDEAAAAKIRTDCIDILVDCAGHTAGNRLGVFAFRPAPVQVTYLGYPNTTGLSSIDYRLTDSDAEAPGSERFYSEKLMRLDPPFLCYTPPPDAPPIPVHVERYDDGAVFGSFNNPSKISEETVAAWSRILAESPGSRLVLKFHFLDDAGVRTRLLQKFGAYGIDERRIQLFGRSPSIGEHLASYRMIDVALDTYPYNGTTTTCEALWMGVPVVTRVGERHSARVGASLLRSVGLEQCVVAGAEDYVSTAARVAANREKLDEWRGSLRTMVASSPLCDSAGFTKKLEQAYRAMWEEHRDAGEGNNG